ncbi:MAG TPA: PepSY-like domain-containing protein [Methylococcus sp.]|nr:PepSY-like domain-containing protein [Methylococcus sp.]
MKTKTQFLMAAVLGASLAIPGQANAGEKELRKSQVPKAVVEAFEKAHPNAKKVEFEEETFEGKTAYEVEYKEDGREYELLYDADGTLLQKEEEIDVKALPEQISQAVTKAHPKAKIKEAEKVMKPDGTVTGYEVEIKEGRKELELDASGQILKTEED